MKVLVVDLNNFAMYPSIAIGYLTAELRRSGIEVDVLSPLSVGSSGVIRERRSPAWGSISQRAGYMSAVNQSATVRATRSLLAKRAKPKLTRNSSALVSAFQDRLDRDSYDVVLVSAYLMYHEVCREIGARCEEAEIPLMIGGPYFSQPEVAKEWISLPGLTALVGGEIEPQLGQLVRTLASGEPIDQFRGIWKESEQGLSLDAPPLASLDELAFPDFIDFPWKLYPNRIVPIITGRGCGWGRCTFCSDITSTAGRTFRSRSPENVLEEIRYQADRYGTQNFVFTDLKLNSNPEVWESLLTHLPQHAPDAKWVASIHAGAGGSDCLSRDELFAARAAGMTRLTTGLESGSQRVLNLMRKGTELGETERVIRDAHAAGISVRVTMIVGYPGEQAADIDETIRFLGRLDGLIDRIVLNRFQIMSGSEFHRTLEATPTKYQAITGLTINHREATIAHRYTENDNRVYRRSVYRLIDIVHHVNRKPLRNQGKIFEGVM